MREQIKITALACGLLSDDLEDLRQFLFNLSNSGYKIAEVMDVIREIEESGFFSELAKRLGLTIDIIDDEALMMQHTQDPDNPNGLTNGFFIRTIGDNGMCAIKWGGDSAMDWKYYGRLEKMFQELKTAAEDEMVVLC